MGKQDDLTPAQFAKLRGLNRSTISRQIAAGQIPMTAAGLIDPKAADRARDRNLDGDRRARAERRKQQKAFREPKISGAAARIAEHCDLSLGGGPSTDAEAGSLPAAVPRSGSLASAQLVYAEAKGRRAILQVSVLENKLISVEDVTAAQTARATAEREALLNWPARIAAGLANKFGASERDMFLALEEEVRVYLTERSHQPLEE